MKHYILLTPGPLTTSETVKQTMMADWCTWDDDYNIEIVQNIRRRVVELAASRPEDYTCVLMQGSGTYVVEATINCSVGPDDHLLVLSNGVYGDRMATIATRARLNHEIIKFDQTEVVCPLVVDEYLAAHPEVTHVSVVHSETTSGLLNPLADICAVVKKHGKIMIVDAMSSFGGVPIDMSGLGIDFLVTSANKCIEGIPGFGIVIARLDRMEALRGNNSHSLSLDIYDQWQTMEKHSGKWRFTSPTHVVRAFKQALDELDAEGGIEARHRRYCDNQKTLSEGMRAMGYTPLLPEKVQSPFITSFEFPSADFSFGAFYEGLKQRGFVIYPGKISERDTFRIGTIGHIDSNDIRNLLEAIKSL